MVPIRYIMDCHPDRTRMRADDFVEPHCVVSSPLAAGDDSRCPFRGTIPSFHPHQSWISSGQRTALESGDWAFSAAGLVLGVSDPALWAATMAPARSATAFTNHSGPVSLEPRLRHRRCSVSDKHLSEEREEKPRCTLPYTLEVFRMEVVCCQLSCQSDGQPGRSATHAAYAARALAPHPASCTEVLFAFLVHLRLATRFARYRQLWHDHSSRPVGHGDLMSRCERTRKQGFGILEAVPSSRNPRVPPGRCTSGHLQQGGELRHQRIRDRMGFRVTPTVMCCVVMSFSGIQGKIEL